MQNLIPAAARAQFLMFQGAPKSIKKRCQKDFEIRPHLESEKNRKSSRHGVQKRSKMRQKEHQEEDEKRLQKRSTKKHAKKPVYQLNGKRDEMLELCKKLTEE